jgi:hypothetical protein
VSFGGLVPLRTVPVICDVLSATSRNIFMTVERARISIFGLVDHVKYMSERCTFEETITSKLIFDQYTGYFEKGYGRIASFVSSEGAFGSPLLSIQIQA